MTTRALPLTAGLVPLALYLVLAAGAAIVVPSDYGGDPRPTPPDEGPHLGYVEHLATRWTPPVFRSLQDNYEGHQPPLYYASALPAYLLARAVAPGETGGLSRPGLVMLRLWSVLLGGLGVWVAWLLGRRVFGTSLVALGPPLFLALWPGRTMIISAITNDGLAEGLCLLTFYLCIVLLAEGADWRRVGLLGLALAGAMLTKSTSLALGPIVLLALVMRATADQARGDAAAMKRLVGQLAVVGAIVAVLVGWWFVRNQLLYGDPLAAKVFEELFSRDRATPEYFLKLGLSGGAYFQLVVINTALSFWGVYGQANVYSPAWYYVLGFILWLMALAGLVRQKVGERQAPDGGPDGTRPLEGPDTIRPLPSVTNLGPDDIRPLQRDGKAGRRAKRKGEPEPPVEAIDWQRQAWTLAWVLLALVVAFFLRFNTSFYQAQARYLFAASGPIALLMTLGWWDVHRRRWGLWALCGALAVMLVMSVWSVAGFSHLVAAHYPPPLLGQ